MNNRSKRNSHIATLSMCMMIAAPAAAEDNVSWRDIDFGSCPLNGNLRVADGGSMVGYMALQGCAARIVASPRTQIRTTPDVARIIGVKKDKPKKQEAKRRKTALAQPPAGTRRVSAMPERPIRIGLVNTAFEQHIQASAQAYRIDPLFLHAIIGTESTYRPVALSHAGARGLMQIMPDTGARFGVAREALYDPATNIETGAKLLKALQKRYGRDFDLILAAYNAGEGAVARYGNRVPPYAETQDYVVKVMARYAALRRGTGL